MPIAFGIVTVRGFPLNRWQTLQQTELPGGDDEVATVVEPVTDWLHSILRKFQVRHEHTLHLEGRYKNEPINQVIEVSRFDVYLPKAGGGVAYVRGAGRIWRDAFRRIKRDQESSFDFSPGSLDLQRLVPRLEAPVAGGWFGRLNIEKVRTAGIFGPSVAESEDWDRYEKLGQLSAITLDLSDGDRLQAVMLCQDWTVVLYRDRGEVANVDFVLDIHQVVERALGA
jgi:hypothetical protein